MQVLSTSHVNPVSLDSLICKMGTTALAPRALSRGLKKTMQSIEPAAGQAVLCPVSTLPTLPPGINHYTEVAKKCLCRDLSWPRLQHLSAMSLLASFFLLPESLLPCHHFAGATGRSCDDILNSAPCPGTQEAHSVPACPLHSSTSQLT